MNTPLLSVCLITYNHEKFIRQAIEGVLMQKVNFDWELIIAEDCSTDNTRAIVLEYKEKYPGFIRLILQENNVGAAKNWIDLINTPKSKYIAYFEGDDYWTDPLKLQKQVDFLELNQEYGLVYSSAKVFNRNTNRFEKEKIGEKVESFEQLLLKNVIPTLTVLCRTFLFKNYLIEIPEHKNFLIGDFPSWLYIARHSKIKYLEELTAVYNRNIESASRSLDPKKSIVFFKSRLEIQLFYIHKYNLASTLKDIVISDFYKDCSFWAIKSQNSRLINEITSFLFSNKKYLVSLLFFFLKITIKYKILNKLFLRIIYRLWDFNWTIALKKSIRFKEIKK